MKIKMNKIFNFENFCVTVFYLLLYFSYDSNVRILRLGNNICLYINILLVVIFAIICIIKKKVKVNHYSVFLLILLLIFTLISNTIYETNFNTILYMEIIIVQAFIITTCLSKENFIKIFIKTLILISISSLIGQYVLAPLALDNKISCKLYIDEKNYYPMVDLGISFAKYNFGIQRNYSFFREPGVFQIFLLTAMIFTLFSNNISDRNKTTYTIILLLTLASTFSTMGIISALIILIAYVISGQKEKKGKLMIILLVLISLITFFVLKNESGKFLLDRTFTKLFENTSNESFSVRYYSIYNNILASLNNPIFGMGYDRGFNYIINNLNQFGTNDVTGSLFIIAMAIGWPVALICNYCFYKSITYVARKQQIIIRILIWISLFSSVNSQNILYTNFFWIIIFLSCCRENEGDNNE